jgi:hypothetical protein
MPMSKDSCGICYKAFHGKNRDLLNAVNLAHPDIISASLEQQDIVFRGLSTCKCAACSCSDVTTWQLACVCALLLRYP